MVVVGVLMGLSPHFPGVPRLGLLCHHHPPSTSCQGLVSPSLYPGLVSLPFVIGFVMPPWVFFPWPPPPSSFFEILDCLLSLLPSTFQMLTGNPGVLLRSPACHHAVMMLQACLACCKKVLSCHRACPILHVEPAHIFT